MRYTSVLFLFLIYFFNLFIGTSVSNGELNNHALIIGIEKYTSLSWADLPCAKKNANEMTEFLKKNGFQVVTLFDKQATRTAILAKLYEYFAQIRTPINQFIFYFSGHSYQDNSRSNQIQYLIPYDKDTLEQQVSLYAISELELIKSFKKLHLVENILIIMDTKWDNFSCPLDDTSTQVEVKQPIQDIQKSMSYITAGNNALSPFRLSLDMIATLTNQDTDLNQDNIISFDELCAQLTSITSNYNPIYNVLFSFGGVNEFQFPLQSKRIKPIYTQPQKLTNEPVVMVTKIEEKQAAPIKNHPDADMENRTKKNLVLKEESETPPKESNQNIHMESTHEKEKVIIEKSDTAPETSQDTQIEATHEKLQTEDEHKTAPKKTHTDIKMVAKSEKGQIVIQTNPENATVRILNIRPKYYSGIQLNPGNYLIEVSHDDYKTEKEWVTLQSGEVLNKTITLTTSLLSLTIQTIPKDATIRILNIVPKYNPGILLQPGSYHIEISKNGFQTLDTWITLSNEKNQTFQFNLKPTSSSDKPIVLTELKPQMDQVATFNDDSNKKTTAFESKNNNENRSKDQLMIEKETTIQSYSNELHGDDWTEALTGISFILVHGGCYQKESVSQTQSNNNPTLENSCVKNFWIGKTEVTQEQWSKLMEDNPSKSTLGKTYPVDSVSWEMAQTFIKKLNNKTGLSFRLPDESEWEYACRSKGKNTKYAGTGNDVNHISWYNGNSTFTTHAVGSKTANAIGIYDMSGNVSEWCENKEFPNQSNENYIIKGGDWSDSIDRLQCSYRKGLNKDIKSQDIGFRLVITEPIKSK